MLTPVLTLLVAAPPPVYADGRDPRALLPQKLMNRQLDRQLDQQPFRLGADLGPFAVASDLLVGTQLPLDGGDPTPFHGFFFSDLYLALEVFEGLDVNLNVLVLNQTASGGFRVLADVLPGLALHLHFDLGELAGDPVRFDLVTPDLDVVTLGEGLLVETTPLEGFITGLRWRDLELRATFGGRVFWQQDDLLHFSLTALEGHLGLTYTLWFTGFSREEEREMFPPLDGHYVSLHARAELLEGLGVAAEYAVRAGGPTADAHAFLGRADYELAGPSYALHLGYQFRYYPSRFGPQDRLTTPSTIPSTPIREDYYATNSFEYLWLSPIYEQWSHTAMGEAWYRWGMVELFGELEAWLRFYRDDRVDPPRVVDTFEDDRLPGTFLDVFYRGGLRVYPFEGLPHRLVAFVSNKSVFSFAQVTAPVPIRFIDRPILFFEAEVRL